MQQIRESAESRPNSFELYGFDFVIDKKLDLWLIEANMSPACAERTPWLTDMLDDMGEGLLSILEKKIVLTNHEFTGKLQQLAEDYKEKRIKPQLCGWIKVKIDDKVNNGGSSPRRGDKKNHQLA